MSGFASAKRNVPMPELADDTVEWTVSDTGDRSTYVAKSGKKGSFYVPYGRDPVSRRIQIEALARAKFYKQTRSSTTIDASILKDVEDLHYRSRLLHGGADEQYEVVSEVALYGPGEHSSIQYFSSGEDPEPSSYQSLVELVVNATMSGDESSLQTIENDGTDDVVGAFNHIRDTIARVTTPEADHNSVLEATRELTTASRKGFPKVALGPMVEEPEYATPAFRSDPYGRYSYGGKWQKMHVTEPERPLSLPAKMRGMKYRAVEEGTVPRFLNRWATDGAIFGKRRRYKAQHGAVLIDQSGSMSLSMDEILLILKLMPAALIATYSGAGSSYGGRLQIVAKDGKRVNNRDLRAYGDDNAVDGPALQWLKKHGKGDLFWISDGYATGGGMHPTYELMEECQQYIKANGITQIEDRKHLEEAIKATLKGRKVRKARIR